MDFLYGVRLHLNMIIPDVLIDIILDYFTQLLWSDIYGTVLKVVSPMIRANFELGYFFSKCHNFMFFLSISLYFFKPYAYFLKRSFLRVLFEKNGI